MRKLYTFILLILLDIVLLASLVFMFCMLAEQRNSELPMPTPDMTNKVLSLETNYAAAVALSDTLTDEHTFVVVPEPVHEIPDFTFEFEEQITEHDLNTADVELLARLLWSSPLENEDYKRQLLWVVFNRVDDERLGLFGRTIDTVVIKQEFGFLDKKAHLSEANLRIAKEEMNRWMSYLDGNYVEIPIPRSAVYARFTGTNNRQLEVLSELPKEG